MFIHPQTLETSPIQLEGYLPYIEENPTDLTYYTQFAEPHLTIYEDRITFTYYRQKHLETIKSDFINLIEAQFHQAFNAGFSCLGHTFDSHSEALANINGAFSIATTQPLFTTFWITKDNQTILLNNADIITLGLAAATFKSTLIYQRRQAKDAVLACQSLEALLSIHP